MRESSLGTGQARRLMDERLRADSDFDAFCLDHFPDVYRRFSVGMERQIKANLLLSQISAELIEEKLRSVDEEAPRRRSSSARTFPWMVLGLALAAVSGVVFWIARTGQGASSSQPAAVSNPIRLAETPPVAERPAEAKLPAVAEHPVTSSLRPGMVKASVPQLQDVVIDVNASVGMKIEIFRDGHLLHRETAERRLLRMKDGREVPDGAGARLDLKLAPGRYDLRCTNQAGTTAHSVEILRKSAAHETEISCD